MKIILYVYIYICVYVCVRGHANPWSHLKLKPSGMDAAGLEPEGGGSQFDMINHVQQEGPKTSST